MSTKELDRAEIFSKLKQKAISQTEAAKILEISSRQIRRLFKNYMQLGALALISKKRGKPSNHQLPQTTKELVVALVREKYSDFGPTLAHEKVVEIHKISISLWSVRNLMIAHGLWLDKQIKKKRVYQLRERRSQEGEMEQMDGSPHDWFEGRGPKCTLLHIIDDATGKMMAAIFAPSESLWPYFRLVEIYLRKHGRPCAFYVDKHGVFRVNMKGSLSGEGITQFGRAMKELDIPLIFANSPQAKGRIERSNQTLQDRLVKELRLKKISTIEKANAFLPTFIEDYNQRFAVIPKSPLNAHRPLLLEHNLEVIFTIQEFRILSKNLTFQYKNIVYQIQTQREAYVFRNAKITIREKQGSIDVFYKGKPIGYKVYVAQEKQRETVDSKNINEMIDNLQKSNGIDKIKRKPALNHPWRSSFRRPNAFSL